MSSRAGNLKDGLSAFRARADNLLIGTLGVHFMVCLVAAALTDSWVPALGVGLPAFLVPLLISRSAAGQLVTRIAVACAAMIFAAPRTSSIAESVTLVWRATASISFCSASMAGFPWFGRVSWRREPAAVGGRRRWAGKRRLDRAGPGRIARPGRPPRVAGVYRITIRYIGM